MSMLQKQKPIENANKVKRNSSSCNSDISLNLLRNSEKLLNIQKELCFKLDTIQFKSPIDYIYNPLKYAKNLHEAFVKKYFENSTKKILFLGMNPGPWGMCQTGVGL